MILIINYIKYNYNTIKYNIKYNKSSKYKEFTLIIDEG